MKTRLTLILGLLTSVLCLSARAQGTAFTYQGRLENSGIPTTGNYDLRFILYTADIGGSQTGPIVTASATPVNNGLFIVTLDFGAVFTGSNYWLDIAVRTNSVGGFLPLVPRQPVTPAPYALFAQSVSSGGLAGLYGGTVNFSNFANLFTGSFVGNGAGLSNINPAQLSGPIPGTVLGNTWKTSGNTGTTPTANFVGTTDNQPLELRVAGIRTLRLEPASVVDTSSSPGVIILFSNAPNVIAGAAANSVASNAFGATVAGGGISGWYSDTGSGYSLVGVFPNIVAASLSTVSGGASNQIFAGADSGVIAGGLANCIRSNSGGSTISGGYGNVIGPTADYNAIGGGYKNSVQGYSAVISGGEGNSISNDARWSSIAGGSKNAIATNSEYASIGGGSQNSIAGHALAATIGGGYFCRIGSNSYDSTIAGGDNSWIRNEAQAATVGGGLLNTIDDNADSSTIAGGNGNFIGIGAQYATIPGGQNNSVGGSYGFAAGRRAMANHQGTFVWADSQNADFNSTATNQFLIRAGGGVGIGTASPEADLHIFSGSAGSVTANPSALLALENNNNAFIHFLAPSTNITGILFGTPQNSLDASIRYNNSGGNGELTFRCGGNSQKMIIDTNGNVGIGISNPTNKLHVAGGVSAMAFVTTSDRNAKENFSAVSPTEVLAKVASLPITRWNFKEMKDGQHLGPMAQDFYAAFGLGGGETTITTVDADGVALAAIQGLNQKLEQQRAENVELRKELSEIKQLLTKLAIKGN